MRLIVVCSFDSISIQKYADRLQGCGLSTERQTMLSRKVVTRSGRGFRGHFPSKKLNAPVQFESLLERDAIKLFENSSEVKTYREQPTIIYYYLDGIPKRYHPDFEVVLMGDAVIHVEVKPSQRLATTELVIKFQAINQTYKSRPEHFVILTEKELRSNDKADFYQLINNNNVRGLS